MKKAVISTEIALNDLREFVNKWSRKPQDDEEIQDNYPDVLEAIVNGSLVIKDNVPTLTLTEPINKGGEFEIKEIVFSKTTRVKPSVKASLAKGIDLKLDGPRYGLVMTAHIAGLGSIAELDKLDDNDYDVVSQLSTLFI